MVENIFVPFTPPPAILCVEIHVNTGALLRQLHLGFAWQSSGCSSQSPLKYRRGVLFPPPLKCRLTLSCAQSQQPFVADLTGDPERQRLSDSLRVSQCRDLGQPFCLGSSFTVLALMET